MAAVGQDLPLELLDRAAWCAAADVARLAGHAQRRVGQRDRGLQARHAVARLRRGAAQIADLAGEAAQEAAIEAHVGIRRSISGAWLSQEMMRRARPPGARRPDASEPCSVIHSSTSARALARVMAEFGGAQMAQPAEAEQRSPPTRRTAASSRTASGRRRSPPCRRRRSGRHRSRSRGWRRRCAGPAARSAAGRSCAERERPAHQRMARCRRPTDQKQAARRTRTTVDQRPTTALALRSPATRTTPRHSTVCARPSIGERGGPEFARAARHAYRKRLAAGHSRTRGRPANCDQPFNRLRAGRRRSRRARPMRGSGSGRWQGSVRRSPSAVMNSARPQTSAAAIGCGASARVARQQGGDLLLAFLRFERAGAIDQRAAGPGRARRRGRAAGAAAPRASRRRLRA